MTSKRSITINGQDVSYTLKRVRRSRSIRLIIHPTGELVATMPWYARIKDVEHFLVEKSTWILKQKNKQTTNEQRLFAIYTKKDYYNYKERARTLVHKKLNHFNQHYNFSFKKVAIKNQKSCWGSCSQDQNLNFNFRILFLSEELQDYLIVHELCHLKEMNHSKKFWELVGETIPHVKTVRKQLREC